jgi:hypothetical protein
MTQPGVRVVAAVAGGAFYVAAGWVLLSHLVSNREALAAPTDTERQVAGVTITISVTDGPTVNCATSADRVAKDTLAATASEVPELFRRLGCWNPGD